MIGKGKAENASCTVTDAQASAVCGTPSSTCLLVFSPFRTNYVVGPTH